MILVVLLDDPLYDITIGPLSFTLFSDCDWVGKSEVNLRWSTPDDSAQGQFDFDMSAGEHKTIADFAWSRQEASASDKLYLPSVWFREPTSSISSLSRHLCVKGSIWATRRERREYEEGEELIWNPDVRDALLEFKQLEGPARSMGVQLQSIEVRRADDLARGFSAIIDARAEALMVLSPNPVTFANQGQLVSFAQRHRLPPMYGVHEYVDGGGLMAYGASVRAAYRRAAFFVDRILKGTRPGDLPVEHRRPSSSSSTQRPRRRSG